MPLVSILMPCYNAIATLAETLENLSIQTLTDFELIAVDDGSADNTLDLLQAWTRRDSRFRVISRPHQGIIPSLNAGLGACQAPYVARMDSDDRSHPERLERQVAYLETHLYVTLVSCLVEGFPKQDLRQGFRIYIDWLNSLVSNEDIRREIFIESPLAHPSVMFRKEAIVGLGGYQEHGWPEDYDLWLRLYLHNASFVKLPQVLFSWREHPERLTRTDSRYSVENFLRAKANYLARGPLDGRDAVLIWGAGMMGRRLGKQLQHQEVPLVAYIDIDPRKIGSTRRGLPILSPEDLLSCWARFDNPVLLAAVGARGARALIRERLGGFGLIEGQDWWGVA
jgi:glycosyltransferase involved in cell wall biosynthesis